MTARPVDPDRGTEPYEVIHLGGETAVVVPMAEFRRLRELERIASPQELEEAEDAAALADYRTRQASGKTSFVSMEHAREMLGLQQ